MALFIGILIFVVMVGCVVGATYLYLKNRKNYRGKKKTGSIILGLSALLMLGVFITVPFGIKTVDAGEVAVVKVFGEAKETKTAGIHFVNVFSTKLERMDSRVQQLVISTEVYTKDAQPATVELIVQFKINSDQAVDIVKSYGSMEMLKSRVEKVSIEKAKVVLSDKTAMRLIETRSELSPAVQSSIESIQDQYYIRIESVVITDMSFSDAFEKAVEDKMIAEQKKLEAEYSKEQAEIKAKEEAEVARIKAEADLVVAKLNAEKALAAAKGDADAQVAIADGQAKALKLQYIETARMLGLPINVTEVKDDDNNVIGYEYNIDLENATTVQYKTLEEYMRFINYLESWDGKLPEVIGD